MCENSEFLSTNTRKDEAFLVLLYYVCFYSISGIFCNYTVIGKKTEWKSNHLLLKEKKKEKKKRCGYARPYRTRAYILYWQLV